MQDDASAARQRPRGYRQHSGGLASDHRVDGNVRENTHNPDGRVMRGRRAPLVRSVNRTGEVMSIRGLRLLNLNKWRGRAGCGRKGHG